MTWRTIPVGMLATITLTACNPAAPEPDPLDIQAARRAAIAFDISYHREIVDRLERDPLSAVYLIYRNEVGPLTNATLDDQQLKLRRTSLRVRNRDNIADDWETKKLEALAFSMSAGLNPGLLEFSEIVEEPDGSRVFRWIKPIVMEEACLACHGDIIDEDILDLLARDYPDDEATGYFEYELGGAYSVRKALD